LTDAFGVVCHAGGDRGGGVGKVAQPAVDRHHNKTGIAGRLQPLGAVSQIARGVAEARHIRGNRRHRL
jgi:hypothetical protein